MNFSQKFLELRKNSGLSQEEAADKLGVSRQAISRWEQGTAYPDSFNLLQISKLFGVSADYLIDDERKSDEKTLPQELSSSGRQSDEIVQSPQLPDDGRRALRAAAWPYLTACAICVVLLNIIGIVVAFYANAAAGTVVLSFAAAVAIAGIVAAAIIYRPAPVHKSGNISAERSGRTSLYLSLMVCFHIGALILELVGFVLLFCYSDAILTNLLTGFGVLLTVAGCITFECVFHSRIKKVFAQKVLPYLRLVILAVFNNECVVCHSHEQRRACCHRRRNRRLINNICCGVRARHSPFARKKK